LLFNHSATTETYTLSLHDALPIFAALARSPPLPRREADRGAPESVRSVRHPLPHRSWAVGEASRASCRLHRPPCPGRLARTIGRSEEHTSELQSRENLVCRLLLEK